MFHPKTLQQRTIIFILVPVFLFLTFAGLIGFRAVRKVLLTQWGETAVANLEREAHNIDMLLNRPKQILSLLEGLNKKKSTGNIQKFIIDQLNKIEGVVDVKVDWPENMNGRGNWGMRRRMTNNGSWYGANEVVAITAPAYNVEHNSKTFSLVSNLVDETGKKTGTIEVIIDFESLISQTVQTRWWNIYKAYLVDLNGNILTSTINEQNKIAGQDAKVFGATGILEQKTLTALKDKKSGTVFGPASLGRPPEEISGFYRLKEAPWTLVVVAPGKKVLQPIIHFRLVYFLTAAACIGIILLFIRLMITQTTEAIKKVSQNANDLARGIFTEPLPVTSRDEVGELTRNFNTMSSQLQKGLQLQEAMNIAREVQLTLLPQADYSADGVEVSGLSVYCDETGGDYFDFIESDSHPGRLHVVVGDVVGHGIGAALLMATLRALVRSRIDQAERPDQLIADVNRQLCRDTSESGNFASLFYLTVDAERRELQWVRAGHDPAILFVPARKKFDDLKGKGLVLGLDADFQYQTNTYSLAGEKVVILISSDGAWEAENEAREQFGRQRLKDLVAKNHHLSPSALLERITAAIDEFRGSIPLHDDITLVAISIDGGAASA